MTEPLVGVITPVHNGATYLAEAIDSILAQTYNNWHCIIADNASTDATLEIATEYAARDPRVKVAHFDELLPIMENWNRAMQLLPADAAYCKVLHADDWLIETCLERFVDVGVRNADVGLIGSLGLRRTGDVDEVEYGDYPGGEVMAGHVAVAGYMEHIARTNGAFYMFGSPTNTMIRSDLVRDVADFYEVGEMHADTDACCRVLMTSDWGFVREPLAATRVHPGQNDAKVTIMKTNHVSEMKFFDRYGPQVLSPDDFARMRTSAWDDYYRSLAEGLVQRRGGDFWSYHRERVHGLGERFRIDQVLIRVPKVLYRKIRNRLPGGPS
ncbi:MAG: glycosyltransferase family 2 protein [Acidimicrobiales bacterium]|jgi:glycosyltransferase involved in cell wall biosynthesis